MKKLAVLLSIFLSGIAFAEPLKTVFNPFTGKPDYITKIDSNTIVAGSNCTSTSNSNGTVTFTCTGGGSGASGQINIGTQGNLSYYSVTGSSNVLSDVGVSTASFIYNTSTLQTGATFYVSSGTVSGPLTIVGNAGNTGNLYLKNGASFDVGTQSPQYYIDMEGQSDDAAFLASINPYSGSGGIIMTLQGSSNALYLNKAGGSGFNAEFLVDTSTGAFFNAATSGTAALFESVSGNAIQIDSGKLQFPDSTKQITAFNGTSSILNQNSLQSGATFFVSSGTVNGNFNISGPNMNIQYIPGIGTGGTGILWAQGESSFAPAKFDLVYSALNNGTTISHLLFNNSGPAGWVFENGTGVAVSSLTTAGAYTATSLSDTGLTSGNCVQAGTGGLLTTTGSACGSGGGGVGGTINVGTQGNLSYYSVVGSSNVLSDVGLSTNSFIANTSILQSGATFYVSSGTVNGPLFANGNVAISSGVLLSGSAGTNGQVLTSGGAGAIPSWTTVSGGGGGGIVSPGTFTWTNTFGLSVSTLTVTSTSTLAYVTSSSQAIAGTLQVSPTVANTGSLVVNSSTSLSIVAVDNTLPIAGDFMLNVSTVPGGTGPLVFGVSTYGHLISSGTASPSLSSCGTSPSIVGTDAWMTITVGSVAATGCTITFANTYTAAPSCIVTNQSSSIANAMTYTVSATIITVSQTALTGDILNIFCGGFKT